MRVYVLDDYRNGLLASFGFTVLAVFSTLFLRETHCRNQTLKQSI